MSLIPKSQLHENYQRQSGSGLSLSFLVIWLVGDLFNLAGVILQKLMFTMVKSRGIGSISLYLSFSLVPIGSLVYGCRYLFNMASIVLQQTRKRTHRRGRGGCIAITFIGCISIKTRIIIDKSGYQFDGETNKSEKAAS
jgi:hypothetical protein